MIGSFQLGKDRVKESTSYHLHIHDLSFSTETLVLNPESFSDIQVNDVLEILPVGKKCSHRQALYLQVTEIQSVKAFRMQISILKSVADAFKLQAYQEITVHKIDSSEAAIEFVEFTFKDSFYSRGDMWRFKKETYGKFTYKGQLFSALGMHARVKEITRKGYPVVSGILTEDTKIIFRSKSARIYWLVQMSFEMWDYSSSGELYYEKFLNAFARPVLKKWKALDVSHSLTIVFFSRTYLESDENIYNATSVENHSHGHRYEDFYKTIIENENRVDIDIEDMLLTLKKEVLAFTRHISNISDKGNLLSTRRIPSSAIQGNFLEAINVTLNVLDKHYMDRDLNRTGNSIVLISPGTGVYEVEENLSSITKQRMMDNGIGIDLVSLSQPPLHAAPLFCTRKLPFIGLEQNQGINYDIPHWMHICYINNEDYEGENLEDESMDNSFNGKNYKGGDGFNSGIAGSPEKSRTLNQKDDYDELDKFFPLPFSKRFSQAAKLPTDENRISRGNSIVHNSLDRSSLTLEVLEKELSGSRISKNKLPSALRALLKGNWQDFELDPNIKESIGPQFVKCKSDSFEMFGGTKGGDTEGGENKNSMDPKKAHYYIPRLTEFSLIDDSELENQDEIQLKTHLYKKCKQHDNEIFYGYETEGQANFETQPFPPPSHHKKENSGSSSTAFFGEVSNTGSSASPPSFYFGSMSSNKVDLNPGSWNNQNLQSHSSYSPLRKFTADESTASANLQKDKSSIGVRRKSVSDFTKKVTTSPANKLSISSNQSYSNLKIKKQTAPIPVQISNANSTPISINYARSYDVGKLERDHNLNLNMVVSPSTAALHSNLPPSPTTFQANKSDNHKLMIKYQRPMPSDVLVRRQKQKMPSMVVARVENGSNEPVNPSSANYGLTSIEAPLRFSKKQINPFKSQHEALILQQQTHNRRRWSHVFPPGEVEFKKYTGPNWKSLCQPAILPLTTDYVNSQEHIIAHYTASFYTIIADLDTRYESYKELLEEMVCQRMMQDFQVVVGKEIKDMRQLINPTVGSIRSNTHSTQRLQDKQTVYVLSMGHRIQFICFDDTTKQIDVKRYLFKHGSNADAFNKKEYKYSIWVPNSQEFKSVSQTFHKYPNPEYNWNYVDESLCGYYTELREENKYRRLLFALCPETFNNHEQVLAYKEKFLDLQKFLNSKIKNGNNPLEVDFINFERNSNDNTDSTDSASRGVVKMHQMIMSFKKTDISCRYEWLNICCDQVVDASRVYHIEFHWLACSAFNVSASVQSLLRKTSSLDLTVVQIPEYSRSILMNLHPFIAHPFIKLKDASPRKVAEEALRIKFNFLIDDERYTIWRGKPQVDDTKPIHESNLTKLEKEKKTWKHREKEKSDRQYLHKSGCSFVRVAPTGFVWIHNRMLKLKEDQELDERLFVSFKNHCVNICFCYELVNDIINKSYDTIAFGSNNKQLNTTTENVLDQEEKDSMVKEKNISIEKKEGEKSNVNDTNV